MAQFRCFDACLPLSFRHLSGHSHQLFHICGIIATNEQMNGILADFHDGQPLGLEKKNPAAFGWSLGAVVTIMTFCAVVVAVDSWRVSQYDEETLDKLLMHLHHCNNSLIMHIPTHGETLYRMAQEKCETIRQRFRSRSGTPVKTPSKSGTPFGLPATSGAVEKEGCEAQSGLNTTLQTQIEGELDEHLVYVLSEEETVVESISVINDVPTEVELAKTVSSCVEASWTSQDEVTPLEEVNGDESGVVRQRIVHDEHQM